MARQVMRLTGLQETIAALNELPKATSRNVLRRSLLQGADVFIAEARANAPDNPETQGYDLHTSVKDGTKLSRRQARAHAKAGEVEVYAGAGPLPQAHLSEFGSAHQKPKPWIRPAWEATKDRVLQVITAALAGEIEKARQRAARKAARIASKST